MSSPSFRALRMIAFAAFVTASSAAGVMAANVRASDPATDGPGTPNVAPVIAADGMQVVVAWAEAQNWTHYAYSSDGGFTFTDGGAVPTTDPFTDWGDPALVTDHAGNFYLVDVTRAWGFEDVTYGLQVRRGIFTGSSLAWGAATTLASSTSWVYSEPALAADPSDGSLYLTWTRWGLGFHTSSYIDCSRSLDVGATWSAPLVLAASVPPSYLRSSRIAVGPDHEVEALYLRATHPVGPATLHSSHSATAGVSFESEVTLPMPPRGALLNLGSGPPGTNATTGYSRPSLAIDCSDGPRRGRTYVAWEAGVNFLDDALGSLGSAAEAEPNGVSTSANALTIGENRTGAFSTDTDQDWFAFSGTAGQTVVASLSFWSGTNPRLALHGGVGGTSDRAAYSQIREAAKGHIVFTLPSTGTYWFRVEGRGPGTANTTYTLATGWHTTSPSDVGRDARDVVLMSSPDGNSWSIARTIVNDDPPRYDNAMPEVAVDHGGRVHVTWYDHRDDAANGQLTNVYRAWSDDGGTTFSTSAKLNDGPPTNFATGYVYWPDLWPNLGQRMSLVSDGGRVYAAFVDGRDGTSDVWTHVVMDDVVSVDDRPLPPATPAFAITGITPNPAAGRSLVTLEMRRAAAVRLTLLDLQGRVAATLVDGELPSGRHRFEWTAPGLPSGLYFLSFEAPDARIRRRVVLAR